MLVSSEIKELRGSYLIRGKVLNHHIIINYVLGLEGSAMSKKRVPGSRRDIQDVQDAGSPFSEKSLMNIYLDASSRYASAVRVRYYGMVIMTAVGKSAMGAENRSWRKTSPHINLSAN